MKRFQQVLVSFLMHKNWLDSQMRVRLNQKKVEQYAVEKKKGARFPPPVVFLGEDGIYWTGDGFHRIQADANNGVTAIDCDVRPGEIKDAILHNIKANQESQGLLFGFGDITKTIKRLLTDPLFADLNRSQIAKLVGTHRTVVSTVALNLGMPRLGAPACEIDKNKIADIIQLVKAGKTLNVIANELGISWTTVKKYAKLHRLFDTCPHCNGTGKILKKDFQS